MKIHKDKTITCSGRMMASILEIMTNSVGSGDYAWLYDNKGQEDTTCVVCFKSGAQLGRKGLSTWYIHSCTSGSADQISAFCELEAANHIRRAISLKKTVEALSKTSYSQRVTFRGLWGIQNDGLEVTP